MQIYERCKASRQVCFISFSSLEEAHPDSDMQVCPDPGMLPSGCQDSVFSSLLSGYQLL